MPGARSTFHGGITGCGPRAARRHGPSDHVTEQSSAVRRYRYRVTARTGTAPRGPHARPRVRQAASARPCGGPAGAGSARGAERRPRRSAGAAPRSSVKAATPPHEGGRATVGRRPHRRMKAAAPPAPVQRQGGRAVAGSLARNGLRVGRGPLLPRRRLATPRGAEGGECRDISNVYFQWCRAIVACRKVYAGKVLSTVPGAGSPSPPRGVAKSRRRRRAFTPLRVTALPHCYETITGALGWRGAPPRGPRPTAYRTLARLARRASSRLAGAAGRKAAADRRPGPAQASAAGRTARTRRGEAPLAVSRRAPGKGCSRHPRRRSRAGRPAARRGPRGVAMRH
jgi:hypothetical protein